MLKRRNNTDIQAIAQATKAYNAKIIKKQSKLANDTRYSEYVRNISKDMVDNLDLALRFYTLEVLAVDIIMFLHRNDGEYIGNYAALTEALCRIPVYVSNVRKMCITLEERKILYIHRADNYRVKWFELASDWLTKI